MPYDDEQPNTSSYRRISKPVNSRYFFVNKDQSSQRLSQSHRKEQFKILSHVRNRKAATKQPWDELTTVLDVDELVNSRTSIQPKSRFGSSDHVAVPNSICDDHNVDAQPVWPWFQTTNHNESVRFFLSTMQPSFNSLDPFHCTSGGSHATAGLPLVADLCGDYIARTTFCAESLGHPSAYRGRQSFRHDHARQERLRSCIDDELLLYSSIAHGSSSLAWENGHLGDQRTEFWIGKTLETLRLRLAEPARPVDNGVILSIFTLALVAGWTAVPTMWSDGASDVNLSQYRVSLIHLRAMLVMVERAGGWHKFSPYILEGMLLVDKYAAICLASKPLIPLTFDPGAEQIDFPASRVPAESSIPDMGTGFRDMNLDPKLDEILSEICGFYHAAAGIWQVKLDLNSYQENLLYCRFQALHYKLLLLQTTDTTTELVRQTTLLILCNITLYAAGLMSTRVMLRHLHKLMTTVQPNDERTDRRVWYWCLCTGATTRLAATDKSWFVEQFLNETMKTKPDSTSSTISRSMTQYIYIPWLQNPQLQAIMD